MLTLLTCHAVSVEGARGPFEGVEQLVGRRVPWLSKKVVFEKAKGTESDLFTLQTRRGRLYVTASSPSAAAAGLNWYLKYYCHRQMSHLGDNLSPVAALPEVAEPETHRCSAAVRYALNYCTYNYTASFYTWADWERELDWMALHGVNQMLVAGGMEAVWQNVMRRLGFSDEETARFIPGPAYTAWWLMGNLEGQGGPMPQSQIDVRKELTKKMLQRMEELGIEPLMPGFFGMVPSTLKAKSSAHIAVQGKWISFTRPDIMDPAEAEFDRVADLFYEEIKSLYGKNFRYFSGDPFHEGGSTGGIALAEMGSAIQRAMLRHFPSATWVFQGWQSNPQKALLEKTDRSRVMVQELFGENTANWQQREGYEGTPFIWCTVSNFGERPGLYGKLERMASEWYRVSHSNYNSLLKGIGIMPEGIRNNPVVYELMLELPWHTGKVDVGNWIGSYAWARYGKKDADIDAAWQKLLQSCYSSQEDYQEGPPENILCARPRLDIGSTSSWGTAHKFYDISLVDEAEKLFAKAGDRFAASATYQADAIELTAQSVMGYADSAYAQLIRAYNEKDHENFTAARRSIAATLSGLDKLFSLSRAHRLDTYIQQAKDAGSTPYEKRNNVHNLLMLITYWGGSDVGNHGLDEYSYRHLSGLMTSYYATRWNLFCDALEKKMSDAQHPLPDFGEWNRKWVEEQMKAYFPE